MAPVRPAVIQAKRPDRIVIHHTATHNAADHSLRHAWELSRRIQRFHMRGRGWDDIGQQFTISRGGHVMEGRNRTLTAVQSGRHVVGAHVAGHNDHAIGIECEGIYVDARPTGPLWNSLIRLCAYLCNVYRLNPYTAIVGHRNFSATACPGDVLYSRLPQLRHEVAMLFIVPVSPATESVLPDLGVSAAAPRREFDHGPARLPGERR